MVQKRLWNGYTQKSHQFSSEKYEKVLESDREKRWRRWASIPLPAACKAAALPFELRPRSGTDERKFIQFILYFIKTVGLVFILTWGF